MYTQCPECRTAYRLKAAQLRKTRGIFRCKKCLARFDALQLISEKAPKKNPSMPFFPPSQLFSEQPKSVTPPPAFWFAGLIVALIVLSGQFFYFESRNLMQNALLRPSLERICTTLHCRLPAYRHVGELQILKSTFRLEANQNYHLQAAIANRSDFAQAYPRLKLTLTDYAGDRYAARIFTPQQYLSQQTQALLASGATLEIALDIAAPAVPIGSFTLELL
ncbi:MAG: zinc-ribbon and DUF3426 domain-containing protein [Gammaproteobacteria bacterium]